MFGSFEIRTSVIPGQSRKSGNSRSRFIAKRGGDLPF